jgi:hypothetical protein
MGGVLAIPTFSIKKLLKRKKNDIMHICTAEAREGESRKKTPENAYAHARTHATHPNEKNKIEYRVQ